VKPKGRSGTVTSFKDEPSITSILQSTDRRKTRTQQGSRKIISQDEHHCLFRLVGGKRADKQLMFRSVEIKEQTTEQR
jgi:hypothetical protein